MTPAEAGAMAPREERPLPRWAWALALLGLLALRVPTLSWGFGFDDYAHQVVLSGEYEHDTLGPFSLFDFGGTPQAGEAGFEEGAFPFWADADMRARFFRPLTSASIALDHEVHRRNANGYHLSQVLMFGLLLALLARLYLALGLDPRLTLLAVVCFGLEDGSTIVVGWIANRSTLLVALGLAGGLLLLNRGLRSAGSGRSALCLALLAGLFALGAKESGVGVLAVFAAGSLFGLVPAWSKEGPRARAVGVAAVLIAALYVVLYFSLGYGTQSAFYPTPWSDPSGFLHYLVLHLTSGVATAAGPIVTDLGLLHESFRQSLIVSGLIMLLLLARPVLRSVRELEAGRLFLAIGILTMLPQTMAAPSDRLIFLPMIGWAPLLACTLRRGLRASRGLHRGSARVLAATMLVGSPLMLLAITKALGEQMQFARDALVTAEIRGGPLEQREVLVLQAPFGTMMLAAGPLHFTETGERNVRIWPLQNGRRGLRVTRTGAASFEFESLDASFLTLPFEYVYRANRSVPEVGQVYRTSLFEVRVASVDDAGVRRFALTLTSGDLDADTFSFLYWDGEHMKHRALPPVGETVDLATAPEPFPMAP